MSQCICPSPLLLFSPHREAMDLTRVVCRAVDIVAPAWRPPRGQMDLARILNDGNEALEESAEATRHVDTLTATRRRRKNPLLTLRAQARHLERVLATLKALGTSQSLSKDDERLRGFLLTSLELNEAAKIEIAQRDTLHKMLAPSYARTAALRRLMRGVAVSDWEWKCHTWRSMASEVFVPLSVDWCEAVVRDTIQTMNRYAPKKNRRHASSNVGWQDLSTLEGDQKLVHFYAGKTYQRSDIDRIADDSWAAHNVEERWRRLMCGASVQVMNHVLQRVTTDISICNIVEQHVDHDDSVVYVHFVAMAFRVKTATGYVVAIRSIDSPVLTRLMQCDGAYMATDLFWSSYDVRRRDERGHCTAIRAGLTGYLSSPHPIYARRWTRDLPLTIMRSEEIIFRQPPFAVDSR